MHLLQTTMNSNPTTQFRKQAFTLVEMLVVIAIIGILAGILLPVLSSVRTKAKVAQAKMEMGQIENAVIAYSTEYGRMPASQAAANAGQPDFTYGTVNTPFGLAVTNGGPPAAYQANNAELMAILLDLERYRNGNNTVNLNHARNPRKIQFLDGKQVNGPRPGIDENGLYRDPWGNPYIVTVDGDGDGQVLDGFYRNAGVSRQSGQNGHDGLFNPIAPGTSDNFVIRRKVAVWSFGPDGKASMRDDSSNPIAADGEGTFGGVKVKNSDNVVSWK